MNIEPAVAAALITASLSAIVALISAFVGQVRITRLQHQLQRENTEESRQAAARAVMQRFRDPLLRSAFDLQSRLFSIVQLGFLRKHYCRSEADCLYTVQSTLYVIAEFLGWVEALRREIQFLDLGDVAASRRLAELLHQVSQAFLTDAIDLTFRLFRGEQRAIGELVLSPRPAADPVRYECIGVAAFTEKLADPRFSRWFEKLQHDIEKLATEPSDESEERLVLIQHALVDVIDFLDPDCVRLPKEYRQRVPR